MDWQNPNTPPSTYGTNKWLSPARRRCMVDTNLWWNWIFWWYMYHFTQKGTTFTPLQVSKPWRYLAKSVRLLANGKHYSAIGIMTTTLFLDCYVVEGTVDGDVFYHFVQSSLLPQLMPFNGTNPNSVIMDNCSIHHLYDVIKLIHSVSALVLFLPPYSPDLMPIEEYFSMVKHFLRLHEAVAQSVQEIKLLITAAFASVTPSDCLGWSHDYGYINYFCHCKKAYNNSKFL